MSYFIPRGNRYYAIIAPLSRTVRYAISLLLSCSCVSCWYLLFYTPNKTELLRLQTEKRTLQEHLQTSKDIHKTVASERRKQKKLQTEYASLQIPLGNESLLSLTHDAKISSLILDSCAQQNNKHIIFRAHGTHNAVMQFLTLLKSRPSLHCTQYVMHVGDNKNVYLDCSFEHTNFVNNKKS